MRKTMHIGKLKEFSDLEHEVIEKGTCTNCGACIAVCPYNALIPREETLHRLELHELEVTPEIYEKIEDLCSHCGYCYYNCPQIMFNLEKAEEKEFGSASSTVIGHYKGVYMARAIDERIRAKAQSGGVATALLKYAMDKKIIRGAVVVKSMKEEPWKPEPAVAIKLEDLLEAQRAKYTPTATLIGVKRAVLEYGITRLGIVATPCQVHGLWTMKTSPRGVLKVGDAVVLILGTFCYGTYSYNDLFIEYLMKRHGILPSSITKLDIDTERLRVYVMGELKLDVHRHEVHDYLRGSCKICKDFTNKLADISLGGVGSPPGWTTVIVRTDIGEEVFNGALKEDYIEAQPLPREGFEYIERLAKMKFEKGVQG